MIVACIASIPDRADLLEQVVTSLLPQVDAIYLYLNGHGRIPRCAIQRGVEFTHSMEKGAGDRGDAGKFFWSSRLAGDVLQHYVLTCDDDIVYPEDYVRTMITACDYHQGPVGVHGACFVEPIQSYYRSRLVFHCRSSLDAHRQVHVIGTGTLCYRTDQISVSTHEFRLPNMADIWFALIAKRQRIALHVIPRDATWLTILSPPPGTTIYDQVGTDESKHTVQTALVAGASPWPLIQ